MEQDIITYLIILSAIIWAVAKFYRTFNRKKTQKPNLHVGPCDNCNVECNVRN